MRLLLVLLMTMTACSARAADLDPARMVYVNLAIEQSALEPVRKAFSRFITTSNKPITIVINSPGGEVISGNGFINDMHLARANGIEINCYVLDMAASMAFQILTQCSNRYALRSSYLLWHGVRVGMRGIVTAKSASDLAADLQRMDDYVIEQLNDALHLSPRDIRSHFDRETLWYGYQLAEADPAFISVSNAFPELMRVLPKAQAMEDNPFSFIFGGSNKLVYIWSKYNYLLGL